MKLTIGQRILLGYGSVMIVMVLMGIAVRTSTEYFLQGSAWVHHTFLVISELEGVRADLLGIESASRGYGLTGDEVFLEPIDRLRERMAQSQKLLRTLTVDNASQQSRIEALDPLISVRLNDFLNFRDTRKEKGLQAAVLVMQQAKGRERMARISDLLTVMENEEHSLLNAREQIRDLGAQNIDRTILYGNLIGFALAAFVGIATRFFITRRLSEFQQLVTSVRDGDLTPQSAREGADEMGKLAQGLNQIVARLRNMAAQTLLATSNLDAATVEILASAREQAALNAQQVAAYNETNQTMQQVSQSGLQITERAKQVTVSAEAVSLANTTGVDAVQKANQTVEAIHEQAEAVAQNIVALSEKTQMVGDILATVNDIAEQSHLLALNAAIEAAAAGEHGRTFSVVAGEIKNLADQSKAATVQVKTILGDIQKEINTSVMLTEEAVKRVDVGRHQADVAASAIRNMTANIDQSVQTFQQIVAGTNQQQIGFENVMQAMKDLSRGSAQAAASNRQTEEAAASLNNVGTQLRLATEGYRL